MKRCLSSILLLLVFCPAVLAQSGARHFYGQLQFGGISARNTEQSSYKAEGNSLSGGLVFDACHLYASITAGAGWGRVQERQQGLELRQEDGELQQKRYNQIFAEHTVAAHLLTSHRLSVLAGGRTAFALASNGGPEGLAAGPYAGIQLKAANALRIQLAYSWLKGAGVINTHQLGLSLQF